MKRKEARNRGKQAGGRKWLVITLAGVMGMTPVLGSGLPFGQGLLSGYVVEAASASSVTKLGEEILTSGAVLMKYQMKSGTQTTLADVIRVDLNNKYVKLDVMTGTNNQFTARQSTGGMAQENGAVAAVNGDFFITGGQGAPMGGQVGNGILMSTPSQLQGMYAFLVTKDGKPMVDEYTFEGSIQAENGAVFPLAGMNKSAYVPEGGASKYSHLDAAYIYTGAWKAIERPTNSSTTPTEVMVTNGVITEISSMGGIPSAVPEGSYILRTHGKAAEFVRNQLAVGQTLTANYSLVSKQSGARVNPDSLQMMIGGHTLLVNGGKASSFTRDVSSIGGTRARTAVGYSKDNRYIYLVTAQKNSSSAGMSLSQLQEFMVSIGVWKGLNLDGGGSTTMVHRPLAEGSTKLTFNTEYGTAQRSIVNALGVFSTAPKGSLKGVKISGDTTLLIGQAGQYQLKGYDTYYNPVDMGSVNTSWKSSSGSLKVNGSTITAVKPGTSTLSAASGSASASMKVTVLGSEDIKELRAGTPSAPLAAGTTVSVPVTAVLNNGSSVDVPDSALQWEFSGFQGKVANGQLTVSSVNPGTQVGYAIARYDGFSTVVVLSSAAESMWEDFEYTSYPISFTTNVAAVTGKAAIVQDNDTNNRSKVLKLDYDMTGGIGQKMYAYAEFNGTTGKSVPATAASMSLDVKGDTSFNWLRAEFKDKNGKTAYVDLAKMIDWSGWKTLNVDLSAYGIAFPAQLKRVYVVNVEEGQDERSATGSVAFDNLSFMMPSLSSDAGLPTGTAQMSIGQKSMTVNGTKIATDAAPLLKDGTTYVPIRFVLDAFGGQAGWSGADQRVTVLRGSKLLELTVGKKELVLNGKRMTSSVAPMIVSGRTLVPLRVVSEQLGLTVKWDNNNKTVTIQS
ncbi:copper amine oxidase N-terminal domain protein [Paenibacillus algicola]|uniref:Copper amine oxidase N-terminal domain protein n=1 Tax=Paenibacillus algicola TaxID=2565926 RepID=A0A4P8XRU8_9BACL|nr:stalk domain-containing protein [Paenibacillus algicola]QCT04581.1 copper amine oxidase N-terminal domain protein [Paenibacillus algicola]